MAQGRGSKSSRIDFSVHLTEHGASSSGHRDTRTHSAQPHELVSSIARDDNYSQIFHFFRLAQCVHMSRNKKTTGKPPVAREQSRQAIRVGGDTQTARAVSARPSAKGGWNGLRHEAILTRVFTYLAQHFSKKSLIFTVFLCWLDPEVADGRKCAPHDAQNRRDEQPTTTHHV